MNARHFHKDIVNVSGHIIGVVHRFSARFRGNTAETGSHAAGVVSNHTIFKGYAYMNDYQCLGGESKKSGGLIDQKLI
jgi:hypothetical protein